MEIQLPDGCGNAPRVGIVADFIVSWAKGDRDAVSEWLADGASLTLVGQEEGTHAAVERAMSLPFVPESVEVMSVITHGRLASCDGYVEADGRRVNFSHVFRFASTAKTAKIAELRSYCVETFGDGE